MVILCSTWMLSEFIYPSRRLNPLVKRFLILHLWAWALHYLFLLAVAFLFYLNSSTTDWTWRTILQTNHIRMAKRSYANHMYGSQSYFILSWTQVIRRTAKTLDTNFTLAEYFAKHDFHVLLIKQKILSDKPSEFDLDTVAQVTFRIVHRQM